MNLNINFFQYQESLKLKSENRKRYLFDPIRKKYLALQPEELVRQLIIQYLVQEALFPLCRIAVERQLKVHEMTKRCDLLVFDANYKPFLLIECKAPQVAITERVFEQIAHYNILLKVSYLVASNGIETYCSAIDHRKKKFQFLDYIPRI